MEPCVTHIRSTSLVFNFRFFSSDTPQHFGRVFFSAITDGLSGSCQALTFSPRLDSYLPWAENIRDSTSIVRNLIPTRPACQTSTTMTDWSKFPLLDLGHEILTQVFWHVLVEKISTKTLPPTLRRPVLFDVSH